MAIPCWKMMPALVAGNTVVFKPSSDTPHCATLLVELMAEAGFPAGRRQPRDRRRRRGRRRDRRQPGRRRSSRSPASSTTGTRDRRAGRPAAQAALSLELGGKNAVVVMRRRGPRPRDRRDPVVARSGRPASAARRASASSWTSRSSTTLLERLEDARRGRSGSGSGLDEAVDVGPLDQRRRARQGRRATSAIGRGEGELVIGGERGRPTATCAHGHFFAADDLRRRRADGPDRARRRSSGRCCRSSRSTATTRRSRPPTRLATACRRAIFTRDVNTRLPGDARLRDRDRLRQRRHDRRRDAPARSAAGRRPATATARRATSRSTRSPSGSRSTSTTRGRLQRAQIDNQPD